jgi:hypothetical protein
MNFSSDATIRGILPGKEIAALLGALCAEWSRKGATPLASDNVVGAKLGRPLECRAVERIEAFRSKQPSDRVRLRP